MKLREKRWRAYLRSPHLQRVAGSADELSQWARAQNRKVLPVASVARRLGVSTRQLWNWIDEGWITTRDRTPPVRKDKRGQKSSKRPALIKPGIPTAAFLRFLGKVRKSRADSEEFFPNMQPSEKAGFGRSPKLWERCLALRRNGLSIDGMTPIELAAILHVHPSTVRTWVREGRLPSHRISPHRIGLGNRRRKSTRKKAALSRKAS